MKIEEPEIATLRDLCEKAAPGPWTIDDVETSGHSWFVGQEVVDEHGDRGRRDVCKVYRDENAAFIAAARQAVPALLDRVAELQADIVRMGRLHSMDRTAVLAMERDQLREALRSLSDKLDEFNEAARKGHNIAAVANRLSVAHANAKTALRETR